MWFCCICALRVGQYLANLCMNQKLLLISTLRIDSHWNCLIMLRRSLFSFLFMFTWKVFGVHIKENWCLINHREKLSGTFLLLSLIISLNQNKCVKTTAINFIFIPFYYNEINLPLKMWKSNRNQWWFSDLKSDHATITPITYWEMLFE